MLKKRLYFNSWSDKTQTTYSSFTQYTVQRNNNTIYSTIYSQAINTYTQSNKATRLPELILQGALQ